MYKYNLIAVWATTPSGITTTEITINAKGKVEPIPVQPTPDQDTEVEPVSKSANFAIVMVCIQVIIAIIFAVFKKSLDPNINHIQILLLLLLVDGYGPEKVYEFMEF